MSNIIVSSEKGTILNYFGLSNTYNPFTDENALQIVQNLDFEIPASEPFVNAGYVAVSTGLLTTSLSFLNDGNFAVIDPDNNQKIMDLQNVIGELGNDKYMPKENQVFWFNKDGLRGTYFLHSSYAGKKFRIINGRYITTSITSAVLNEMFKRTTGVPSYIEQINNYIKDIYEKIGDGNNLSESNIQNKNEAVKMPYKYNNKQVYRQFYSGSYRRTGGVTSKHTINISTPNKNNIFMRDVFVSIGALSVDFYLYNFTPKNGSASIEVVLKEPSSPTIVYSFFTEYTEN